MGTEDEDGDRVEENSEAPEDMRSRRAADRGPRDG